MTVPYSSAMPPIVMKLDPDSSMLATVGAPSVAHLKDLAWGLNLSATAAQTAKKPLEKAGLGKTATTAIQAAIDIYTDAVNALIAPAPVAPSTFPEGFLTKYIGKISSGTWPPVDIPMPPIVDPNASTLDDVLNDIKGAVNTAIGAFQAKGKDGGEVANALISLENALDSIVATVNKYYPQLLKDTV